MKKYFSIVILLLSIAVNAQELELSQEWKQILNNERQEALNSYNKGTEVSNIESLLLKRIISLENGGLENDQEFLSEILKKNNYEYYLYAFWNKNFFFKNYLHSGFDSSTRGFLKQINTTTISTPTIKNAVNYLKAIVSREKRDFNTYQTYIDDIPALKRWQYCGVFENLNQSGLDVIYAPETTPYSELDFDANSNGKINWYTPKNIGKESYQFMSNHSEYGAGVHYAQTFITSEINQRVILKLGNSSAFKVWVNDVLILENTNDVNTDLDAYNIEFNLSKGVNRLLIKNAESSSSTYLIARITDMQGQTLSNITDKSDYSKYNKSTLVNLDAKLLEHPVEAFFKKKIKEHPSDFLYKYALMSFYIRNGKYTEVKKLLLPLNEKYIKSSFIRKDLIQAYTLENDITTVNNLKKNMILDDPDYYMSLMFDLQDNNKLSSLSIDDLQLFLDKFSKATNYEILKLSSNLILESREMDKTAIRSSLDRIMKVSNDWVYMQRLYGSFYSTILSDDKKTINILENINANYFDDATITLLANKYEKLNEKEKVIELYEAIYKNFSFDNYSIIKLVKKLISYQKYDKALFFVNKAIENYNYSFEALRLKADILVQQGKKDEAIRFYKKSLSYDSGNNSIRKKIHDLTNTKDVIEEQHIKDLYNYIATNRNKIQTNNYGYNILLDDAIVLRYAEGGGKYRLTFVYEITAEAGVERFKEYDLGLSGNYRFIKTELVKKDKSLVPADKKGSSLVFKGLEIGDVVYIEYENSDIGTGRFYKDYTDYYQFDSFHPCLKTSYTILVPENININYTIANGELDLIKDKVGEYTKYTWVLENDPGISQEESYMPNNVDIVRYLHISTIENWSKISNWYSDLVRSQKIVNAEVESAYNSIFPQGIMGLSQEERAKKIYYYIMNNFNYSSVSFRQSGFIPQKPSKTISTKLGDCKDFSTLFVTLAEKAGLDSNLVLILTNDFGQKSTILPSQDFNHCIVKVMIDNKGYYLELTNKNLPFKSLPTSLINATALEIPHKAEKDKENNIFKLPESTDSPSVISSKATIQFVDNKIKLDVHTKISGAASSYYVGLFENPNYENIKKDLQKDFENSLNNNIVIDTIHNIKAKRGMSSISYNTKLALDNENKKLGSIIVFQLPILSVVFENSIINLQKRSFPIEYTQYETINNYNTSYNIILPEGKNFVEVPESVAYNFKSHSYAISYKLISDQELKVDINAITDIKNNISTDDYEEFRLYVSNIIKAKEAFIGFK
ncbi:DUF3857 domain-containing protein [Aureibaculum sp. A20]|uniref:DUF3857 domain-containing protein n=1 Tax=Aureibaculum flavum TaxID=2795986 RepID=A0ABS0WP33_9FLAO|nr:transglutaminase domain-containing protein [Aureibaculum flavum]MBJ2173724.1 DUF3857 domain-containing protein [Aureibaculum flavum]